MKSKDFTIDFNKSISVDSDEDSDFDPDIYNDQLEEDKKFKSFTVPQYEIKRLHEE